MHLRLVSFLALIVSKTWVFANSNSPPLTANVIKLANCPPDHVLRPCRCSKFTINYLKPELLQTLHHRLPSYEHSNVHIICSHNDPNFDLSVVLDRIREFYSKGRQLRQMATTTIIPPSTPPLSSAFERRRSDQDRSFRFEDGRVFARNRNGDQQNLFSSSSEPEPATEETIHSWYSTPAVLNFTQTNIGEHVQLYGFVSSALPYLEYEFQLNRLRFEYIDLSYTNLRAITFVDRTLTGLSYESVQTLLLAYNQLENDDDEQISAHLATSRLVRELSKFHELRILSLRGNRLKHFNLPVPRLRIIHHYPIPVEGPLDDGNHYYSADADRVHHYHHHHQQQQQQHHQPHQPHHPHLSLPPDSTDDLHSYGYPEDVHPRQRERIQEEVRILFPKLRLLDLAENQIKIIAPNSYNSIPQLSHLNLEANAIEYVYSGAFRFAARPSTIQTQLNGTQLSNLEKNTKELLLRSLKKLQIVFEDEIDSSIQNDGQETRQTKKSSSSANRKSHGKTQNGRTRTILDGDRTLNGPNNGGLSSNNEMMIDYRSPMDQLNIYLGRNKLNCSKINNLAFDRCAVRLHLHLDLNDFEYVCEENFGDLLLRPNVLSVNFRQNPLRCTHCENKWLFAAKVTSGPSSVTAFSTWSSSHLNGSSSSGGNGGGRVDQDRLERRIDSDQEIGSSERESVRMKTNKQIINSSASSRTRPPLNQRPLKYDLSKLVNVKCSLRHDNLQQTWSENSSQVHLMDFSLSSFGHCNLRKRQLVEALKHYALFLRAFSVLPQSSLERIDEILRE